MIHWLEAVMLVDVARQKFPAVGEPEEGRPMTEREHSAGAM
jgi:hypothetical protein